MNAVVQHQVGGTLVPSNMNDAMRLAEMMAKAKTLPAHFHNSPGDTLMVVEQAMHWNMSPFAVAQCTSVIKGKLMFEGKLVAAAVQHSGAIEGNFDYVFSGENMARTVQVTARRRGETEPRSITLAIKDAITENGIWKKQPDQQLVYAGTRVWARRWTPGVLLGVYAPEEFDGEARDNFAGTTIDAEPEAAAPPETPKKRMASEFLDALQAELNAANDREAVDLIYTRDDVQKALDVFRNGLHVRLNAMLKAALDRTEEPRTDAVDDFPGVTTRDAA